MYLALPESKFVNIDAIPPKINPKNNPIPTSMEIIENHFSPNVTACTSPKLERDTKMNASINQSINHSRLLTYIAVRRVNYMSSQQIH